VVAAYFHSLLAVETAAEEGKKVVLVMLGTGVTFLLVIALGDLTHWVSKRRRTRD
jgi:hypothetical protein